MSSWVLPVFRGILAPASLKAASRGIIPPPLRSVPGYPCPGLIEGRFRGTGRATAE